MNGEVDKILLQSQYIFSVEAAHLVGYHVCF